MFWGKEEEEEREEKEVEVEEGMKMFLKKAEAKRWVGTAVNNFPWLGEGTNVVGTGIDQPVSSQRTL